MSELDLSGKSLQELEAIMEAGEIPTPPEAAPSVTEAPPVVEETKPVSGDAPTEIKPEEPSLEQIEKDLLLARLEQAEEERKKAEAVAGRHGGELGYLRQKIRELEAARSAPREEDETYRPEPEQQPVAKVSPPARDRIAAYVVSQAVPQAISKFESQHPDATEIASGMAEYLKSTGFELNALLELDDPIQATQETERVLQEAYFHARADRKAKIVAELTTKRADQFARLQDAKKNGTISGSGGSAPAPFRPKTPDEMTLDELDAYMRENNPVY